MQSGTTELTDRLSSHSNTEDITNAPRGRKKCELMSIRKVLLVSVLLLTCTTAVARPPAVAAATDNFPTGRTLLISGVIASGNILPLGKQMLALAQKSSDPITLIINSPGGEINTGLIFLNYMQAAKALGTPIRCYVPLVAASLAFHILTQCSERHALTTTLLLWHRARESIMFAQVTAPMAEALGRGLYSADEIIIRALKATLGIPEDQIMWHLENETLHTGLSLHEMAPEFITSHNYVEGLLQKASDKSIPHNQSVEKIDKDEIIYIDPSIAKTFLGPAASPSPAAVPSPVATPSPAVTPTTK